LDGEKDVYKGLIDCCRTIYRKEGWKAFYKGLSANMVKCLPEAGIQFATYDIFKYYIYQAGQIK